MSFRALDSAERGDGRYIRRFTRMDRVLHLMVVVSFFGLVLTGLPLHFAGEPWARFLVDFHGGVRTAGQIHRVCAVITFAYFVLHLGTLAVRIARSANRRSFFWGPDSLVPQPKDLRDIRDMFRWFVGRGERPRFDRFSYLEKFDYWAVFWGVGVIGASGLLLWFPEFFAGFLPGWMFNVATIVHGDEALLALCFIFVVHFFNGQLRPGKFPLDLVIFTGRATEEYLEDEHPLELERIRKDGRFRERLTGAPPRLLAAAAAAFGISALLIGLTIAGLVIWASLR